MSCTNVYCSHSSSTLITTKLVHNARSANNYLYGVLQLAGASGWYNALIGGEHGHLMSQKVP